VDNASQDNSANVIKRMAGLNSKITFIESKHNTGFAGGNNLAAESARDCDWIALLNPDAIAHPDWIFNLLVAGRENLEFKFFASRMMKAGSDQILDGAGDVYHPSGMVWRRAYKRKINQTYLEPSEVFSPCGGAAFYNAELFYSVNGFDESYFCYVEDIDLAFRMRLQGARCLYIPEAIVDHVGFGSTSEKSAFSIHYGFRNGIRTFWKNMPFPLLIVYLPQHILMITVTVVWFSLNRRAGAVWGAIFSAISFFPQDMKKRLELQNKKKIQNSVLRDSFTKGILKPYFKRSE
jgi:GT2 family glycosyltransferase